MKKYVLLFLLIFPVIGKVQAQSRNSFRKEFGIDSDLLLAGLRVNYMQGKDGFVGGAFHMGWHETNYLPVKHVGFAVGSDFKLAKDLLMAPKVTLEYGYYIGVIRVGYLCYTDLNGRTDNRISAEIGVSLLSFIDLTYVHTFGFNRNPFNLGNDYFNFTMSIPLCIR